MKTYVSGIYYSFCTQVPWGNPYRGILTTPEGLRVASSPIPGARLGVFSDIFILKYTWLGEYEGEFLPISYGDGNLDYAWEVSRILPIP